MPVGELMAREKHAGEVAGENVAGTRYPVVGQNASRPDTEYRLQIPHPPPGICGAIARDVRISCGIDLVTCPGVSRLEEASWL